MFRGESLVMPLALRVACVYRLPKDSVFCIRLAWLTATMIDYWVPWRGDYFLASNVPTSAMFLPLAPIFIWY